MKYMLLLVLHNPDKMEDLINAWEEAGVQGVTFLTSAGLGRMRQHSALRDDLPLIPSLNDLIQHEEVANRTLMTLVEDETLVDKLVTATQKVTGNLDDCNTGILAVIPIARVYGLQNRVKSSR
jgi:nitrogen regulatory protein PII